LKLSIDVRPFSWRDRLEFSKVAPKHAPHRAQAARLDRVGGHLLVQSEARCFLLASGYRLSRSSDKWVKRISTTRSKLAMWREAARQQTTFH
jgi:hypothetical protein